LLPENQTLFGKELVMKRLFVSLLAGVLLPGICLGQSSVPSQTSGSASQEVLASSDESSKQVKSDSSVKASQEATASENDHQAQSTAASQLKAGTTIHAVLVKPVDVRKNKPGDEVIARSTQDVRSDGRVVVPKGSKIVGRVTEAKVLAKGEAESTVGIVFDHAILKNGSEMPLALGIQAISSAQANASAATEGDSALSADRMDRTASSSGRARSGGLVNGIHSSAGSLENTAGNAAGTTLNAAASTGTSVAGHLTPASRGAVGLPGMTLSTNASNSTNASVIGSKSTNVRLDSGTEMILNVKSQ
jgi:hypothetical protein